MWIDHNSTGAWPALNCLTTGRLIRSWVTDHGLERPDSAPVARRHIRGPRRSPDVTAADGDAVGDGIDRFDAVVLALLPMPREEPRGRPGGGQAVRRRSRPGTASASTGRVAPPTKALGRATRLRSERCQRCDDQLIDGDDARDGSRCPLDRRQGAVVNVGVRPRKRRRRVDPGNGRPVRPIVRSPAVEHPLPVAVALVLVLGSRSERDRPAPGRRTGRSGLRRVPRARVRRQRPAVLTVPRPLPRRPPASPRRPTQPVTPSRETRGRRPGRHGRCRPWRTRGR